MRGSGPGSVRADAVHEVVAHVRQATPTYPVVVVAGPRGAGRSTVLRRAADALGHDTLWIDCAVFGEQTPLQSLRDALFSTRLELFPRPMATALSGELDRPGQSTESLQRALWSVIRPGVARLAGSQVIADDFDLLDQQSQQVVAYALRRIAQLGTPVLFSVESTGPAVDRFPTVDLKPLDVREARELIEDLTGLPVPYRVAERLAGRTDGNLLALTGVTKDLTDDELGGRQLLPHPLRLPMSIARRLCSEGDDRLALLAGLAFDETLPVEVAEQLVGSPEALRQASIDGIVRFQGSRVIATQSAAAIAAWWLAPTQVRTRMHLALAGSDLPCAPIHGAATGQQIAEDALAAAAFELYGLGRQGHTGFTLEMLGWVLPRSGYRLVQRLMDDGYLTAVRTLLDVSARAPAGLSPGHVDALRTRVAVLTGLVSEPIPVAEVERHPAVISREWAQTVLGVARSLFQRDDYQGAEGLLDATSAAMAQAPADCRAVARFVRAELAYLRCEDRATEELVASAEEWLSTDTGADGVNTAIMVFYLLAVGSPGLAGAILNRTQPADGAGALPRVAHVICRLQTELVLGHYAAADNLVDELDRLMPYNAGGAHALSLVMDIAGPRGPSRTRERIEWRLDHADVVGQQPRARSEVAAVSGRRHLIEGDYERAVLLLGQGLESRHTLYTGASSVLASLLEADLAAGMSPAANRAVWKGLGDWWPDRESPRFAGLQARCEALCVEPDEIDSAFEAALALSPDSHPVDLARTYLAYGRRLLLESRPDQAARQLDRAQTIFVYERLGGWVAHVERLRTRPNRAESHRQLSPTEREVVALVLQRRTNAEIARTLFMSKRTVELHLTRLFRKFAVSRKSELIELDDVRAAIAAPIAD